MEKLNLPAYSFRYKEADGKKFIFDSIRLKYVVLTPEEWVRQNFLRYMAGVLNYPASLTGVEKQVIINGLKQRCDIVVYNRLGNPVMIAECKAPSISIGNHALEQAARYNIALKVPYLVLTNGLQHFCVHTDSGSGQTHLMEELPTYEALQG